MSEKEEIIFIDLIKGGCAECPHEYGTCERCYYRQEAIERMARSICRSGENECIGDCDTCDLWKVGPEKDLAEAALNSLLGEK